MQASKNNDMVDSSGSCSNGSVMVESSSSEPSQAKWMCEVCTFENWTASSRCTMCHAPRTPKVITQQNKHNRKLAAVNVANSSSGSADIFKLNGGGGAASSCGASGGHSRSASPSLLLQNHHHLHNHSSDIPDNSSSKWGCQMCTYLNWPRALRCTQCLTPRRRVSPVVSRNAPMMMMHRNSNVSPPPPLSSSTQMATALEAMRISAAAENNNERRNSSKWNCLVCTYENWPRTKRCVLCAAARGASELPKTTTSPLPSTEHRESPPPQGASRPAESDNRLSPDDKLPSTPDSGGDSAAAGVNNCDYERRMRQLRRRLREADWSWLTACMGVVEGDMNPVEAYLNTGGVPNRKLTNPEVALLSKPSIFEAGHTLVHLAIKFHREDMLATLLSQFEGGGSGGSIKCVPSYVAPDLASAIRRHISQALRQRKGHLACYYIGELATYSLPPEIEDLPPATQEQLYGELMDRDAQRELEEESDIINWSEEIRVRLGSRLHALWNRSAGDCLLDSVLQATWGVFDRDNTLRRAMADSLHEAGHMFYGRWREWEMQQALELDFTLDEAQLAEDWAGLLNLASQPGASLEQLHVFCLAHVLRRPIVVYGVKYVKSWRGENLGYARFEGVYLPLLWEPSFCSRSPIALGYTRGHFCALVPPEPVARYQCRSSGGATGLSSGSSGASYDGRSEHYPEVDEAEDDCKATYLPLVTSDRKQLLPIHFLSQAEVGNEEVIMRQWLDVCVTETGLVVAQQRMAKPPLLVAQMTEEWLNHYRKLAQSSTAPFSTRASSGSGQVCSSGNAGSGNSGGSVVNGNNAVGSGGSALRSSPISCVSGSNQGGYSSDGDSDEE